MGKPEQEFKATVLQANLSNLPDKDKSFAASLLAGYYKYGSFSEKQEVWVDKLCDRAQGFDVQPPVKSEEVGSFAGVMALFKKAKEHLKWPKINLQVADQNVELSLAGPKAKCPGTVNVTDGGPYGSNVWFGRVDAEGRWTPGMKVSEEDLKPIRRVLQSLAQDPAGAASKYGKLTGRCCFCNKALSDPKSTAVGYGLTCASHYGLASEWKKAASVLD